jgi:hypothetical protein
LAGVGNRFQACKATIHPYQGSLDCAQGSRNSSRLCSGLGDQGVDLREVAFP